MVPAKDISRWQGTYSETGEPIVLLKIGGGDDGLYYDSQATNNYNQAKAHGHHVGGYWFIGWTAGPAQEASFFDKGMRPYAENDVFALDIESGSVPVPGNAPDYVSQMVDYIHSVSGVYPLLYMNLSTLNAHNWDALLQKCGLWLADWAVSPEATIPTNHTYVMQQYSDGPNYDHDEWFGTVEEFDRYGFHANQPTPTPTPDPTTTTTTTEAPAPDPTTTTTTTEAPAPPEPDPTTTTTTTEVPLPPPFTTTSTTTTTTTNPNPNGNLPSQGLIAAIVAFFVGIWNWLRNEQ